MKRFFTWLKGGFRYLHLKCKRLRGLDNFEIALKSNKAILFILIFFIVLTFFYFRYVIFSPSDALVSNHIATDLYGHFAHVHERVEWLGKGFFPIGDYWVPRGGGYPASNNDWLFSPPEVVLMILYAFTGSFTSALKLSYFAFYILTLATSYWYGITITKRRDAGAIFAVSYTFSMYMVNQLEHVGLVGAAFLVPLTLVFWEKLFTQKNHINALLAGLSLFLIFLSDFYILIFTLMFIMFRLLFALVSSVFSLGIERKKEHGGSTIIIRISKKSSLKEMFKSFALSVAIFLFLSVPFVIPYLSSPHSRSTEELNAFSRPPSLFFLRNTTMEPYGTEIQFMYVGISVLFLALIPLLSSYGQHRKSWFFYFFVAIFFCFYSIGKYSPVNIAAIIHDYVPFASLIRVPGRAMVIAYLCFSMCACMGYIYLKDWFSRRQLKNNPIIKNKKLIPRLISLIIPILISLIIFSDLTLGFEPKTKPMVFEDCAAYDFIRQQHDDSRIIEIPSVHDQQAMTYIYTGHDTINWVLWGYGFFDPLYTFCGLYHDFVKLSQTSYDISLEGLVGYWNFDDRRGSIAQDNSGLLNNGAVYGAVWSTGKYGSALSFDGENDYVEIPHSTSLNLTNIGTIEAWVKIPSVEAVGQGIIVQKQGGWNRRGWLLSTVTQYHIRFQWQAGDDVMLDSQTYLTPDVWHHVVGVMDGSTMKIFIDGEQDPNTLANTESADTTAAVRIGYADVGELPFKGEIDEVRIYNRALTTDEIKARYIIATSNIASKLAFYGVKYILLRKNPEFYSKLRGTPAMLDYAAVQNIKSYLTLSGYFEEVYSDSDFDIFNNLEYRGKVFSIVSENYNQAEPFNFQVANVTLEYSQSDPNNIKIYVKNEGPVLVAISQSFDDGWVATVKAELSNGSSKSDSHVVSNLASIQSLQISDPGEHWITLHYTPYERSLLMFLVFYPPVAIMTYFVYKKRKRAA